MKKLIVLILCVLLSACSISGSSRKSQINDMHLEAAELYKKGDNEGAIRLWKQVLEKDPNHIEAWNNIAVVQKKFLGNLEQAENTLIEAVDKNKKNPELLSFLGDIKIERGSHDEGMQLHKRAKELSPKDSKILTSLGIACYKIKDLDCAITNIKDAIKYDPEKNGIYFNLGLALIEAKRFDEAIQAFKSEIERSPLNSEAYAKLGDVYLELGKSEEAIEMFKAALEIEHDLPWPMYNLGVLYHESDPDLAVSYYTSYLTLEPENPHAWTNLGLLQLNKNDKKIALQSQLKAVELGRELPNFVHNLALTWYKNNCFSKALEHLTHNLEVYPLFRPSFNLLNKILAEKSLKTEADIDVLFLKEKNILACKVPE